MLIICTYIVLINYTIRLDYLSLNMYQCSNKTNISHFYILEINITSRSITKDKAI